VIRPPGSGIGARVRGLAYRSLDRWYVPLILVLALPLVSVPATSLIQSSFAGSCALQPPESEIFGSWRVCPTHLMIASLAPGLLGFASLLWMTSQSPVVRQAAIVASAFAFVRIAGPVSVFLFLGAATQPLDDPALWMSDSERVSVLLWLLNLVVLWSHALWTNEPGVSIVGRVVNGLTRGSAGPVGTLLVLAALCVCMVLVVALITNAPYLVPGLR
jgi:hypothetical protein